MHINLENAAALAAVFSMVIAASILLFWAKILHTKRAS